MRVNRIQREVFIESTPERVWDVLTGPEHLAAWYAYDGAEVDLRPGGRLALTWKEHGRFLGVVERVDPHRHFAFRWVSRTPDVEPRPGNSTLVEFTLSAEEQGTLLQVVESGFESLEADREQALEENAQAWEVGLKTLASYIADDERGPS